MTQELFRKQAVEHRKQSLHGSILLLPKLSHTLILSLLLLWMTVVIIWLLTSHYARKETVVGWLEPPEGIIRVYAETNGIVQKILVAEGEHVAQDQPLLIVNDDRILASGDHLNADLLREYTDQKKMINRQLIRTQNMFKMRDRDIEKRITSAQNDLILLDDQLRFINERYKIVSSKVERMRTLKRSGHVSAVEFDNAMAEELTLKSEQQSLLRNQITQRNTLEQLHTEQKLLPEESANAGDQLRSHESDIAQQITQLSGRNSHIIRASRAGIVNNMQAREGQQVSANNIPLLTLFPNSTQLAAHLLVPVRSIGFIEAGQSLAIRYDAFSYQKFGIYQGKVLQVSKTLLLPNELLNSPVVVREPVYRVTAVLLQPTVKAYGKDFTLKPGMTLSADVNLGDRSLIQWLLEPIYSLQGRI